MSGLRQSYTGGQPRIVELGEDKQQVYEVGDPPCQSPCRELLLRQGSLIAFNKLLNPALAHLRGRDLTVLWLAPNKLDPTIVTAVRKVDNCVPARSYSSPDYYKLTAVSKE